MMYKRSEVPRKMAVDAKKIVSVINSCITPQQLVNANKLADIFKNKYTAICILINDPLVDAYYNLQTDVINDTINKKQIILL